jgi:Cu(I)/Ag(I) efflux system protein CusF
MRAAPRLDFVRIPASVTGQNARNLQQYLETNVKSYALLIALITGLSSLIAATAAEANSDHNAKMAAAAVKSHKAKGTLNKIDPDGTVNITHGPVESLGWPGMTMNFQVKSKVLLMGLKAGQKIDFDLAKQGGGYVITAIKPVK